MVECPYCKKEFAINHDDGDFGYENDIAHRQSCPHCEKAFVFYTKISFHYEAKEAECLNNGKHDFKITNTFPKEFSQMECSMCEQRRELTEEERLEFKVGTKQSYMESLNKTI